MPSLLSTAGLARASARRPWVVLVGWVVILVLAGVAATGLGDAFTTDANFTNRPESVHADELVEARLRGPRPVTETVLVHADAATVDDPAFRQVVERTTAALAALPEIVKSAVNYYQAAAAGDPSAEGLVSQDRRTTLIPVTLVDDLE